MEISTGLLGKELVALLRIWWLRLMAKWQTTGRL